MKRMIRSAVEILGMARVGYLGDSEAYEVYVNTNDGGNIPHFHLRNSKDWDKFHSCIKIMSAEYFEHQGKEHKLNASLLKDLCKFLSSPVQSEKYRDKFENNWQLICFLWELNNSNMMIPDGTEMPDYSKL